MVTSCSYNDIVNFNQSLDFAYQMLMNKHKNRVITAQFISGNKVLICYLESIISKQHIKSTKILARISLIMRRNDKYL